MSSHTNELFLQFRHAEPAIRKQPPSKPALDFGEPGTLKIVADVEKQNAIVAVFKVRWF